MHVMIWPSIRGVTFRTLIGVGANFFSRGVCLIISTDWNDLELLQYFESKRKRNTTQDYKYKSDNYLSC